MPHPKTKDIFEIPENFNIQRERTKLVEVEAEIGRKLTDDEVYKLWSISQELTWLFRHEFDFLSNPKYHSKNIPTIKH